MQGWVSIIAASAVLSAGLVAGLSVADAGSANAAPAVWNDPPARSAAVVAVPSCTAAPWAGRPTGCSAQGRPVRVIALTRN